MTDFASAGNAADAIKYCVPSTKNLPGGTSAVVPPDPMPNSEVKRRSADGSVGSPHARVGNCQASNRRTSPVRKCRAFSFACCLSVSALLRRDKSAGSGFARCAATARRAAGRTPAVAARHQTKQKAIRKDGLFALRQTGARWRCAYRAYRRHLSPVGRANSVPPGVVMSLMPYALCPGRTVLII